MTKRKTADAREKELRLAIHRIERGRARTDATKLSVLAVANEVGVSGSLIHNHYPAIAELIRTKQGATQGARFEASSTELKVEREKSAQLRTEVKRLQEDIARLATINEMLMLEIENLRTLKADGKVAPIRKG